MINFGKILVRILPWDPWLPRCSSNLARSCHGIQGTGEIVNPGSELIYTLRDCPSRTAMDFLQKSDRSGTYQTLSARILQVSYISDKTCRIQPYQTFPADSDISCMILQDQTFSSKIFQDSCRNNALSSKILEVKFDRFFQIMNGSLPRVFIQFGQYCMHTFVYYLYYYYRHSQLGVFYVTR